MASASDNFDRADGAIGANWTANNGSWNIASNLCVQRTVSGTHFLCRYTATTPATNDFYSEAVVVSPTGGSIGSGVCVRAGTGATATDYRYVYYGGDFSYLSRTSGGVETVIDTGSAVTAATNYTARLTATGSTLDGTRGGAADVSATDATLTSGGWGLASYTGEASGTAQSWNNWSAADSGAAAASQSVFRSRIAAAILAM